MNRPSLDDIFSDSADVPSQSVNKPSLDDIFGEQSGGSMTTAAAVGANGFDEPWQHSGSIQDGATRQEVQGIASQSDKEARKEADYLVEHAPDVVKPVPALAAAHVAQGVGGKLRQLGDVVGSDGLTDYGTDLAEQGKVVEGQVQAENELEQGTWANSIRNALSSIYQQAPGLVAGGAVASTGRATLGAMTSLLPMGAVTGGAAYHKYRERGQDVGTASLGSAAEELVEVSTELLPTVSFFKAVIPGGKLMLKQFVTGMLQYGGSEYVGETLATLGQDITDKYLSNPAFSDEQKKQAVNDYFTVVNPKTGNTEAWDNFLETMRSTTVQTGLMMGGGATARAALGRGGNSDPVDQAPVDPDSTTQPLNQSAPATPKPVNPNAGALEKALSLASQDEWVGLPVEEAVVVPDAAVGTPAVTAQSGADTAFTVNQPVENVQPVDVAGVNQTPLDRIVSGEGVDSFAFHPDSTPADVHGLWNDLFSKHEEIAAANLPKIEALQAERKQLQGKESAARKQAIDVEIATLQGESQVVAYNAEMAFEVAQEKLARQVMAELQRQGIETGGMENDIYAAVSDLSDNRNESGWNKPLLAQVVDYFNMPQAAEEVSAPLAPLHEQAHAAATSPLNDVPQPTAAQIEAGNYQKGHVKIQGLDISIENPAGSVRSGVDPEGKPWKTELNHHYGYIKGTIGRDKDHIDVFIGPNPDSQRVFIVDQVDPKNGVFDEHKTLLGFETLEEARQGYLSNYTDSAGNRIGGIANLSIDKFKEWLKSGKTQKPYFGMKFKKGGDDYQVKSAKPQEEKSDDAQPVKTVEVKKSFKPEMLGDQLPLPMTNKTKVLAKLHGLTPSHATGGKEYHVSVKALQGLLDRAGDGYLYRVVDNRFADGETDFGDPKYRHKLADGSKVKGVALTTSLKDAQGLVDSHTAEGYTIYKVRPADLGTERVLITVPSDRQKDELTLHVISPVPVVKKATVTELAGKELAQSIEVEKREVRHEIEEIDTPTADELAALGVEVLSDFTADGDQGSVDEAGKQGEDSAGTVGALRQDVRDQAGSVAATNDTAVPEGEQSAQKAAVPLSAFGAQNKMFTADKAAAAREILRKKLSQLNAGIDPEMVQAGIELAGYYVEAGARSFREYSAKMLEDLGEAVQPFLKSFYLAVRNYPGFDNAGMDNEAFIDSMEAVARVEAANKPGVKRTAAKKGNRTLRGDYGVEYIDAYTDAGEVAKEAFMKDAKAYLQEIGKILTAEGWQAEKVNVNAGGIAGGGDITLIAFKPESELGAYVTVGTSGIGGWGVSMSPSKVNIMYRATTRKNKYTGLVNRWDAPWDISSGALAAKLMDEVEKHEPKVAAEPVKATGDSDVMQWAEDNADEIADLAGVGKKVETPEEFIREHVQVVVVSDPKPAVKPEPVAEVVAEPEVERLRVAFNAEHSGIELHFPGKPDAETIAKIKNMGFRWSMRNKLWYAKDTPLRRTFVEGLKGKVDNTVAESIVAARSAGSKAYKDGLERLVPAGWGKEEKTEWYRGWDTANLETPLPVKVVPQVDNRTPYGKGQDAFKAGDGRKHIPQQFDGYEKEQWLKGWDAANLSSSNHVNELATNGNNVIIESGNKAEGVNLYDYSGNGIAGPPILAVSESASVQTDGGERGSDQRVGSSSPVDTERDGYPDESGPDRSGSVARVPRTVHSDGPGERLQSLEDIPTPVSSPRTPRFSGDNPGNYRITDADKLGAGTPGQKIKNNLTAIRLVKDLEREQRYATPEEQVQLARYVGWGGLRKVFDPGSKSAQEQAARQELEQLLTKEEFFEARQSSETAFYTSPQIISSMYKVLRHFGFAGGYTLEPTYGTGAFIGLMPADMAATSKWYGSELDPVTAKIGQSLYPDSQLLESGFQNAEFPYGRFDLAVGNPPFSDTRITDTNKKRAEIDGMKTHNYIIAKSGMHLKPGNGLLAMVVTSRFLDTKDAEARDFLQKNYQFLGAIRLPSDAFKDAGTAVVTDMVFFRRLLPNEDTAKHSKLWLTTDATLTNAAGADVTLNGYFKRYPEMMLGEPSMTGGQFGGEQFTLKARQGQDTFAEIEKLLTDKDGPLVDYKDVLKATAGAQEATATAVQMNREDVGVGGYVLENDSVFMRVDDDEHGNAAFEKLTVFTKWTEKTALGATRLSRIKGMLKLREQTYKLIEMERFDSARMDEQRQELNRLYDDFVKEHGYINDSANSGLMADDIKIEFGLETGYRKSISLARAKSLGVKPSKAKADKATILKERIYYPLKEVSTADSPRDGYGISLSERGRLDLDYIAALTGLEREAVISDLAEQGLIFNDPVTGSWIQEDAYLSGNVKAKLKQVENREGYEKNVGALKGVLPADVTQEQIYIGLGATWVPAKVYGDFAEYMGVAGAQVSISKATGGVTIVSSGSEGQNDINVTLQNKDYTMAELFNLLANKRPVVAYDRDKDGNRVVNRERTKELAPIAKRFAANFRDWIMADPMRAQELTQIYNDSQNTHAERLFNGKHLKTVGANPAIRLRNSQRNAAWRMIQQQVNLLDHVVGAGKTFTIVTGVMERRRLGLSHKPMVVVPNHIVGQWAKDFLAMYPGANILAATEKDFAKKNRRRLFSRIATGKFDAIIVGHSSFGFIPMEAATEIRFQQEEMEYLERALYDAQAAEDKRTVRTITNRIDKKRQRLARLMARERDDVATFESMGIDYLVVDESHEFKNLEYATTMQNVAGMGTPTGASKSFDLYSKVRFLRGNGGGVTFATGTPISNSLVEMYTLLRYLNYEGLKERDLDVFDAWAKTYSQIESRIEYTAAQKLKDRAVIMFQGEAMPELLQLYKQVADVVTMKDLKRIYAEQVRDRNKETGETEREEFPVPLVKGGVRQLQLADPTKAQKNYMDYLVARASRLERLGGENDPKTDNHLWVMNDARKMALDIRLVDPAAPADPDNKVNRSAVEIKRIYDLWQKDKGTQLVFCDLSTPAKDAAKDAKVFIAKALEELVLQKDSRVKYTLESLPDYRQRWGYLKTRMEAKIDEINTALETEKKLTEADIKGLERWRDGLEAFIDAAADEEGALTTADIGFSVYDELKATLIDMGIPASEVKFIHEATTRDKKDEMFAMVNSGEIRVLIGSSKKMGAGTNVQERVVALHHLDAPWRPSDVEQREGRAIRQGNMLYERDPEGFELEILAYSTQQTFDAVMWQVLARKAETLEQYRNGDRSFKDAVESDSDSYANFMAESTGNPAFKEKYRLENEIEELEGVQRNVQSRRAASDRIIRDKDRTTKLAADKVSDAEKAAAKAESANGFKYEGKKYAEDLEAVYLELEDKLRVERQKYVAEMEEWAQGKRLAWEDHLVSWLQENPEPGEGEDNSVIRKWHTAGRQEKEVFDNDYTKSTPPPKKPGDITIAQLAKKSEAAQLAREIIRTLDDSEAASSTIELQYGKVEVLIGFEPAGNNSDVEGKLIKNRRWEVTIGGYSAFRWDAVHPPEMRILGVFRDGEIKKYLRDRVQSAKTNQAFHANAITEAERILAKVKFEDGPKLEQKRERYKAVVEEVNELEKELEERRKTEANVYISGDGRRFGGGGGKAKFSLAYHGSPHDHDGFDMSKIGTGEGNQTYGYGLYFAGNREVAEFYKDMLAKNQRSFDAELVDARSGLRDALSDVDYLGYETWQEAVSGIRELGVEWIDTYEVTPAESEQIKSFMQRYDKRLSELKGKLYHVELAPAEDEYMLWDKPIRSDQADAIYNGMLGNTDFTDLSMMDEFKEGSSLDGEEVYKRLASQNGEQETSAFLHSLGIRGIKYLDGSSRGKGEGNYNYVIFNDADVSIKAKYMFGSGAGVKRSAVEKAIQPLRTNWRNAPPIEVVQSESELPLNLRDEIQSLGVEGAVRGVFDAGRVFLVADNLNSDPEAVSVLLHEVVGHYGVAGMLGKDFDYVLGQVALSVGNKGLRRIAERYGFDLSVKEERLAAAAEKLAEMAERNENPKLLGRAIAAVRAWLRSMGVDLKWTDNDILALLVRAKGWVTNRKGFVLSDNSTATQAEKEATADSAAGKGDRLAAATGEDDAAVQFSLKPDEQADTVAELISFVPDKLADAVAPLGYRTRKALERVTSSDFKEAVGWFFRNPFFQAEADPLKQPFYSAGSEREVNRMAVMLNMFGWEPGSVKERSKLQRVKDFLFTWQSGDKVLRWEQLKDALAKLEPGQRKAFDLLFSQGDIGGIDYSTLPRAKMNPRIKRAEPTEETFKLYKKVRNYIDVDVEKVITEAIQQFLRGAGMEEGEIRQHISDYRKHKASRIGWLTRDHGDGDIAVRVYRHVKELRFETRSYEDDNGNVAGEQALLALYPGKELESKLRALAGKHKVTVIDTAPGGVIFTKKGSGDQVDDLGYAGALREFQEEAAGLIPESVRKNGVYPRVLVYAHYVATEWAADKLKKQIEADYTKAMPHNYRAGEEYFTDSVVIDKMSESMYADMRSDMAVEAALGKAITKAFQRGEVTKEELDEFRVKMVQNTAEVLLGRAAGKYQIRRAPYLIEGYQSDSVMDLYQDYMTGVAGQITKAAYAREQFDLYGTAQPRVKRWAERYIGDSLRNMGRLDRISGNIRALAALWYMGFKVSTVMINLSQPLTIGFAELGRYARWPLAKIMRAQRDVITGKLSAEETAIFQTAIYQVQEMETAMGELSGHSDGFYEGASKGLNLATGKALALFQHAEILNRKTMILAAYRVFRKQGLDDLAALEKALTVNSSVNFDMGRHNLPGWARNPAGRTAYALQSFAWNNFNYIYNRATSGDKEQMIALMRYMGMLLLLGGLGGWPLLDEFDKMYRKLRGYSFLFELKSFMKKQGKQFGSLGDSLNAFIWHGLPALAGLNVSNSMRLQMPVVSNWLNDNTLVESAMGVSGGLLDKMILGVTYAGRGQVYRSAEAFAPEAVAGGMRAYRMSTEGVTTSHGKKVFHEGKPMKLTDTEAALRVLGFQPLRPSEASAEMNTGRKLAAFWKRERDDALDEYRATKRLKPVQDFNIRLKQSQAKGLVEPISSETIKRANQSKANRKKTQWEQQY